MRSYINEFQTLQKAVPSAPEIYAVDVVNYNTVYLFNNTVTPISWGNEYNTLGSYGKAVIYKGNENEINTGTLNVYLAEQIIGQPIPEATVVKKRFI